MIKLCYILYDIYIYLSERERLFMCILYIVIKYIVIYIYKYIMYT